LFLFLPFLYACIWVLVSLCSTFLWATKVNIFCVGIFLKIEECEVGKRHFLIYAGILGKIRYLKVWVVSDIWVGIYHCLQICEDPGGSSLYFRYLNIQVCPVDYMLCVPRRRLPSQDPSWELKIYILLLYLQILFILFN
jgi:hypothetical protein